MILKIERYWGMAEKDPESWWMLDDIKKISYYRYKNHPFIQNFSDLDANISLLDFEEYLKKFGTKQDSRDVIKLVCRLSNGNEFVVLFDTTGYILNDDGKTIEKLIANYR
jgi:hypothetical protein